MAGVENSPVRLVRQRLHAPTRIQLAERRGPSVVLIKNLQFAGGFYQTAGRGVFTGFDFVERPFEFISVVGPQRRLTAPTYPHRARLKPMQPLVQADNSCEAKAELYAIVTKKSPGRRLKQ